VRKLLELMNDDDGTDRKEKVISATQWCVYSSNLGNNLFIYFPLFSDEKMIFLNK